MSSQNEENYYKILEVSETATAEEIKKSYRKLSLKYHPDRNGGNSDPDVSEKYKKINGAYEILGDVDKKIEYDSQQNNPFMKMSGGRGDGFSNLDEIFSNIFFGGGGFPGSGGFPGGGFPSGGNIHIFRNGIQINQQPQKPPPIIQTINVNMEQVLNGSTIPVEIERWIIENGLKVFEKQTIYVTIPKGVDDNEIILMKDHGNILNENCKGDLKLFIKIENTTNFTRNGLDLIIEKQISLKESLCGFSFELKYINGKVYTIHNNSGNIITPNYIKIIPNMGLTREQFTGNLCIHFKVNFPEKLTEEQILKINEIHF
jgi:DnaJ-class molecular chaperone